MLSLEKEIKLEEENFNPMKEAMKDLPDFIAKCIELIIRRYPKDSYKTLVKRIGGISKSTFERLAKKEIKSPSLDHMMVIIEFLSGGNFRSFLMAENPGILRILDNIYRGNEKVKRASPALEDYLRSPHSYEITIMAASLKNLTKEDIFNEFGKRGLDILEVLIEEGIIKDTGNRVFIEGPINLSQQTMHTLLEHLVSNNYHLDNFGRCNNWLSVNADRVNLKKASPVIREILIKAKQDILDTLNNPEYKGNDIVWTGLVMDSLLNKLTRNEKINSVGTEVSFKQKEVLQ